MKFYGLLMVCLALVAIPDWLRGQTVYFADGYHGGYFLASRKENERAFRNLFELLERFPNYKVSLEFEPYTLERMLSGAKFASEKGPEIAPAPSGWGLGNSGDCQAFTLWDSAVAHKGKYSVKLILSKGTASSWVHACQGLSDPLPRGKTLIFSGYVKTKSPGAHLYIDAYNGGFIPGSSTMSPFAPPSGEWEKLELKFKVPQNARVLYPQGKLNGPEGEAWFDDLSLKVEDTGEELLQNGGFEESEKFDFEMPEVLEKLKKYIKEGKVEIVGGTYTQPLLYPQDGESVVRQFLLGCRATKKALGVDIKTYAAQEPCFISQMPQIIKGFGFTGCIFRNCWAIFGSPPQIDAQKVLWEGPDGSQVESVPRYGFDLHRGFGWSSFPNLEVLNKCNQVGISEPLFIQLADYIAQWVPWYDRQFIKSGRLPSWVNFCQMKDAKPYRGKTLVFSGYAKTKSEGVHLYIDAWADSGAIPGTSTRSAFATPDNQWQRLELTFKVPEIATRIFPQAKIDSSEGEAWFDNLSLKVQETGEEILENGSFENGTDNPTGWALGLGESAQASFEWSDKEAQEGKKAVKLILKGTQIKLNITTFGEYIKKTPKAQRIWHDPYGGFEHRYPWGYLAGEVQKDCREVELALKDAESLAAFSKAGFYDQLEDAWRLLCMAQHHDVWVCAPVKFGIWRGPEKSYAELCHNFTQEAKGICDKVIAQVNKELLRPDLAITVFNTTGRTREEVIEKSLKLVEGKLKNPVIADMSGKPLDCQVEVKSRHPDGSAKEIEIAFSAQVPPMSYKSFLLKEGPPQKPRVLGKRKLEAQETEKGIILENEFYRLVISRQKGLESIYDKQLGKEILRSPAHFSGYFPDLKQEKQSVAKSINLTSEAFKATVDLKGEIASVPYTQRITLCHGSPIIEFITTFDFGEGIRIGSDAAKPFERTSYNSDCTIESKKLRFVLPLVLSNPEVFCDHPYDVRKAPRDQYFGISWVAAQGEDSGAALLFDRPSAFVWSKEPANLELVLGYGGQFIYAPNETVLLSGSHNFRFAIVSFTGTWEKAQIPQLAEEFLHPLLCCEGTAKKPAQLVRLEPEEAAFLGALYRETKEEGRRAKDEKSLGGRYKEGGALIVRLFNPYTNTRTVNLTVPGSKKAWEADLFGNPIKPLTISGNSIVLSLRPKQIRTLCFK